VSTRIRGPVVAALLPRVLDRIGRAGMGGAGRWLAAIAGAKGSAGALVGVAASLCSLGAAALVVSASSVLESSS
jgi:hypothetical protein